MTSQTESHRLHGEIVGFAALTGESIKSDDKEINQKLIRILFSSGVYTYNADELSRSHPQITEAERNWLEKYSEKIPRDWVYPNFTMAKKLISIIFSELQHSSFKLSDTLIEAALEFPDHEVILAVISNTKLNSKQMIMAFNSRFLGREDKSRIKILQHTMGNSPKQIESARQEAIRIKKYV